MYTPLISIIIATRNSEKTLSKTLESVKKQTYPQNKIEVLVIDGQSTDQTRNIAKEFGYKVVDNSGIGFISGKNLGYLIAKGKYLIYLDSDEEINNHDSLKIKLSAFLSDKRIKGVISTGYKSPSNFSAINKYINELGDPFSYFIYRSTINEKFFIDRLLENYRVVLENKDFVVFDFSNAKVLPLIELVAMGCMVDLKYLKKEFPEIKKNPNSIPHLLYLLNTKHALFAITKNDSIAHYSTDSFKKYLRKIAWRVRNNIYNKNTLGEAGFEGRSQFQSFTFRLKRYLFIPYSLLVIFPLIDSLYLSLTRKNLIFLMHPFLCIYTSALILYHYFLKIIKIKPNLKIYGT